ncbi:MAG: PspA/IM30 family protein [Lachnospiraceae bacterium]|nr:PspA/IM30 family protein [Lachnospiraceae bacterium]
MGILQRFGDIMSANINALLDKCEDPAKMVDQCLRDLEKDLGKVKAETASVMAEETRAKRELDEVNAEMKKYEDYAKKALLAGNEEDAKKFLEKKNSLATTQASLQQTYDIASANATKMRQMHDKISKDIVDLNARKDAIKAKVAVAKTQEKMNKMTSKIGSATNSMNAFDRMEEKANKMLDAANAMAELNAQPRDEVDDLAAKYDTVGTDSTVDDELAALKAQMGL